MSWALPVPAGAYAKVPAWTSPAAWMAAVRADVLSAEGYAARRRINVSVRKYLAVAVVDRRAADFKTGRSVTTSNATVARRASMLIRQNVSKRVVERARALLIARGFAVTLVEGRELTVDETEEAFLWHGGYQVAAASVRALTVPRRFVSDLSTGGLSVSTQDTPSSPVLKLVTKGRRPSKSRPPQAPPQRATARRMAAPRPASTNPTCKVPKDRAPRALATIRLAAQLQQRMPWLGRGLHQGHVCDMLDRNLDTSRYARWVQRDGRRVLLVDDRDITSRIEAKFRDLGVQFLDAPVQRDPIGYLAWGIQMAIDPSEETRMERYDREQDAAAERAQQSQAEAAREAARRGVEDSPEHRAFLEQERELRAAASRRRPAPAMPIALPHEPTRGSSDVAASVGIDELVTAALLGEGRHPAEFPTGVQELHGRVLRLARMLTDRGWALDADAARAAGDVVLTDAAGAGRIAFAPPAELPADAIWRTGADGAELADDVTVHEYVGRVETSARPAAVQESAAPADDGSSLRRAERRTE
ncbi:replication protein [Clavibacter michiganensis]|uniref:replication protein n=1 Tax=Clavibacter michiganensis TaxID=28447 RepID=UPI001F5B7AE6|nr:replication protein [Clavibacter michiganensis]